MENINNNNNNNSNNNNDDNNSSTPSNYHHLEMEIAPPYNTNSNSNTIEQSQSFDNNDNNNNNNDNNNDNDNDNTLVENQSQKNDDRQSNKNSGGSLFGKSFFDDVNNSIYGEDVNLIAQPFIGYIRRHEKKLSYEVGEYSVLLRESKQLMSKVQSELDSLLKEKDSNSSSNSNSDTYDRLGMLSSQIKDTVEWLFDVRKIYSKMDHYYGPSTNPIGTISQIRMLTAYRKILEEGDMSIDPSSSSSSSPSPLDNQSMLLKKNISKIVQSLQKRLREGGGVSSTVRRMDGSLDYDVPLMDLNDEEKVAALVHFIDALHADWTTEKTVMTASNDRLLLTVSQLKREVAAVEKERDELRGKAGELELKVQVLSHEKALMEANSLVP